MLLRVSPVAGIWGFKSKEDPDYELWFTLADPKPQDISVEELPQDMRNAVAGALRTKALIEVNENGEVLEEAHTKVLRPAVNELGVNPVIEHRAKELLKGGVSSVRREVSVITNSLLLSTAIAVEKQGKNRKTVIGLLEKQLVKATDLSNPTRMGGMYSNLIEEEEGEIIECPVQGLAVEEEEMSQEEVEEVQERLEAEQEGE
jgi:hypothetical protein